VKKIRKIPYFEAAPDLAEKANERFHELKYLLVGTYEQIPAFGEAEFHGKAQPYDGGSESAGKDKIVDTRGEVTPGEYERIASDLERPQQQQEEPVMPRLNLRDDALEEESGAPESGAPMPPTLRDVGTEGSGRMSPILMVALLILVLGLGVFALNYFNVIHLWGKKAPAVAESTIPEPTIPEPEVTPPAGETAPPAAEVVPPPAAATPEVTTPARTEPATKPARVVPPPSGTGNYTVQVSSWASRGKADSEVGRLAAAGFGAFVEEGMVGGQTWYRVRVGRYETEKEAAQAAKSMQPGLETDLWVARVGK
jgi:cell division septation protein DedD